MALDTATQKTSMRRQIQASHERSRRYGLDPSKPYPPGEAHLSPAELSMRREENREFLDAASVYIGELHRFVAGDGFIVGLVDKEGYLIEIAGDKDALKEMPLESDILGYRWTEKDVGTCAISMSLRERKPVQITAEEHFRRQGQKTTCSASPVFDQEDKLIGVISMSGRAHNVHPHTLGLVMTAAKAIENHMSIARTSKELLLRNNFMNGIIESIDSGVIVVDKGGRVIQVNNQGKQILRHEEMIGRFLADMTSPRQNWQDVITSGIGYTDREVFFKTCHGDLQLLTTAKPILDATGQPEGLIFVFHEINRIRRLVNKMAGSQATFTFEDIVGDSSAIREAKDLAMLAATGKSNVLLLGETGTGKELFAQAIHNSSERRNHPFVAINCGSIPRELLESELFGYADGAFTGATKGGRPGKLELAHGGTVFLDEVGDMPKDMQVNLLRVLQSGEVIRVGQHKPINVDIRVIAASQHDLAVEVTQGNFREDLFYRLDVLPITVPPLRDRGMDILLLAEHFLRRWSESLGRPGMEFSPHAERFLKSYHWPGNVRELQNLVERAVNLAEANVIEPAHFGPLRKRRSELKSCGGARLQEIEKETIQKALEEEQYNVSRTAVVLGITRATLYKKLKKYSFRLPREHV